LTYLIPMKIIYALHRFLPRFFSGTEVYTYQLAQEMRQRGHEVQIFCADEVKKGPDSKIIGQEDEYNGLKVHRINFNRKKTPNIIRFSYNNPLVADHFKSFLSSAQPDLVHITSFLNLSAAIIDPIKKFSIPAIFTATDYWCFCPKSNLLVFDGSLCNTAEVKNCLSCLISLSSFYEQVLRKLKISPLVLTAIFLGLGKIFGIKNNPFVKAEFALKERSYYILEKLKNLDLIIAPTPHLQGFFARAGFSPEKVMLSGYGLNLDWIKPHSSRFSEQPLCFGYIGMLAQLKGVDILIRSFNSLASSKRACLKIYGDDSHFPLYAKNLKQRAHHNPAISFPGTFSPDQLGEELGGIDVLIVPSMWYENAPLIISEAFAAGVPVIGSDVPGISLLVKNEVNGLLFPRGDEKNLTRCLEKFLHEPDLLTKLKKNLPPVKSIQENGNELEEIYYKLIKNQTKTAPAMS
jgi:glycosyltransferase involved in cell wall biosynthesis